MRALTLIGTAALIICASNSVASAADRVDLECTLVWTSGYTKIESITLIDGNWINGDGEEYCAASKRENLQCSVQVGAAFAIASGYRYVDLSTGRSKHLYELHIDRRTGSVTGSHDGENYLSGSCEKVENGKAEGMKF